MKYYMNKNQSQRQLPIKLVKTPIPLPPDRLHHSNQSVTHETSPDARSRESTSEHNTPFQISRSEQKYIVRKERVHKVIDSDYQESMGNLLKKFHFY